MPECALVKARPDVGPPGRFSPRYSSPGRNYVHAPACSGCMIEHPDKKRAMGSEELQRTMEFLAQHQVQAWSSIQSLQAIVREHSAQIERLAGHVREIADLLLRTVRLVEELDRNTGGRFLELDERFRRTDERFPQLEERFRETDERLRQTDGRVNALIALAERCFQSGKQ